MTDTTIGSMPFALPDWATAVLADPRTNRAVLLPVVDSLDEIGPQNQFAVAGRVVYLLARTRSEMAELLRSADPATSVIDHQLEALRPGQVRFRRLLARFAASLPAGAVVTDLACNDGEFAPLFAHCRYLGMDLSTPALEVGIDARRLPFGVLADVCQPPLVLESLDAFVSTGTLWVLPPDRVASAALNLLRFVKAGGRVAMTVPHRFVASIVGNLPTGYRMVEHEVTAGPIHDRWHAYVGRIGSALIRKAGGGVLSHFIAAAHNRLAGSASLVDRLLFRLRPETSTMEWLVFERNAVDS
jgi:hypothetical protein